MPNDTRQANTRVQVDSAYNPAGLNVVARSVSTPVPNGNYNAQLDPSTVLIMRSLGQLADIAGQVAAKQAKDKAISDEIEGAAWRKTATQDEIDNPEWKKDKSVDYIRGVDIQSGYAMAVTSGEDALSRVTSNPNQYPTIKLAQDEIAARMKADMEGMSDDEKQGYMEKWQVYENKIVNTISDNNEVQNKLKLKNDNAAAVFSAFDALVDNPKATDENYFTEYEAGVELARKTGLPMDEANDNVLQGLEQAAIKSKDADLILRVAKHSLPDENDPNKTVPGMYFTSKGHPKVIDAHDRVKKILEADAKKNADRQAYDAMKTVDKLISDEKWNEAEAYTDSKVKDDTLTDSQGISRIHAITKAKKEAEYKHETSLLYRSKQMYELVNTRTNSEIQEAGRTEYLKDLQEAGNDPVKQGNVLAEHVSKAATLGVKMTYLSAPMNANPDPEDQSAFVKGYAQYSAIRNLNPAYAEQLLPNQEQGARYKMMEMTLQANGTIEQAVFNATYFGTEEAMAEGRKQISNHLTPKALTEKVSNEIGYDAIKRTWRANLDATDALASEAWVRDRAEYYAVTSGGKINSEQAVDQAIADYKNTHTAHRVRNSDRVVYIRNSEGALTDDDQTAMNDLSESMEKRYKDTNDPNYDPAGYYAAPEPDGSWRLRKASNSTYVIENGKPVQFKSIKLITGRYMQGQRDANALKAEEEQAARQAKSVEGRRQYLDSKVPDRQAALEAVRKKRKRP